MKNNCCPGVIVTITLLALGASAAAILSYVPRGGSGSVQESDPAAQVSPSKRLPDSPAAIQEDRPCCSPQRRHYRGSEPVAAEVQDAPAKSAVKRVELGKNVFLEIEDGKRRVVINSVVCLRMGQLGQLLTRKNAKEHEAILAAEVDASVIHSALLVCQAKAGHPIRFQPKVEPPTGTAIKITLEYRDKNKTVRVPAQQWIRNTKTRKDLNLDWVFAGSVLIPDPLEPKAAPFYGANSGDVICVANIDTALLDLPIDSGRDNAELSFEANTERIPAVDTPVLVILEPVLEKKKN